MFLFWFSVHLFTSKMQKKSTKTSCINLSINVCVWESPVSSFFPSTACCLSSANLRVRACACACSRVCVSCVRACACMCLHMYACVSVTPSSTCCVGIRGAGEAGACGGAVSVSMITCNHCSSPPFLPSKKTLVLSASALRSRCGISQRTRLQSDQLFKLQVSASGETHVHVYIWFLHILSLHTKWLIMP